MSEISDIKVLFDGAEMQLVHLPGSSDYALVTFDIMHARANGRAGFALKLALKHDIAFFGIVPRRPNWYPASEALACADRVSHAKDRPLLGYGASMGGYGVLKYGAACGLDAALAMSPQATIDPDAIGAEDPRYGRYYDPALHGDMAVRDSEMAPLTYAVCDPLFAPDEAQRALLGPSAQRVDVPFMGHHSSKAMTPSANALARFNDALAGRTDALTDALQQAAQGSLQAVAGRATQDLAEGRADSAYAALAAIRSETTLDPALSVLFARACLATGHAPEAIPDMQAQVDRVPDQVIYLRLLADLFEASGDMDKAIAHMSHAVDTSSNAVLGRNLYRMMAKVKHPETHSFAAQARARWPEQARLFEA